MIKRWSGNMNSKLNFLYYYGFVILEKQELEAMENFLINEDYPFITKQIGELFIIEYFEKEDNYE